MEVGAVKQAFNNEVILLKKSLNQAKIHVIHKLTRKAKTLVEKKSPEHLKDKLKKKAESAVKEVLIIKKIKAKDIAKFIITHTGEVKSYLNKPNVDNDKACARLVLHKSLQDKYKYIRNRFGNVPIKDLFMSRQERRKLKKEAMEEQKNKKTKKRSKVTETGGDWTVEDVHMEDDIAKTNLNESEDDNDVSDEDQSANQNMDSDSDSQEEGEEPSDDQDINESQSVSEELDKPDEEDNDDDEEAKETIATSKHKEMLSNKTLQNKKIFDQVVIPTPKFEKTIPKRSEKKIDKKVKDNKNKNLNEKLQSRKFKKDLDEGQDEGNKVVDPFFITASGDNYMSLAEPRQPDEVKEIHKQGNRKERRAAMFGYAPKTKPRQNNFNQNGRFNKFDNSKDSDNNRHRFNDKNDRFDSNKRNSFKGNDKFNTSKFSDRSNKFNDKNSNSRFSEKKFNNNSSDSPTPKDEKLHPSWEAKKKQSSILPFQGKKIVFNES